jgi:pimeloyl-ACP methyl ester carboxylesterase
VGGDPRPVLPGGGAMNTATVRSTDGTEIAFQRLGAGPAVVVVHGGLGTSAGWQRVAAKLADRFEVFLFDRRGRGDNHDRDRPHSLDREVQDVEAVLGAAGPGASLVGHSFGGAVALETARRATPGAVAAVALYEPAVGVGGTIAPAGIDAMDALIARGEADAALDMAIAGLDAAGLVHADPRPPGARRPDAVLALAPTVPRELRAVTQPGLDLERYSALDARAVVLAGSRSPKFQRRNCERLVAMLPHARLVWLEGLGHVAHTAAPDVVATELAAFLAAHQNRPASSAS